MCSKFWFIWLYRVSLVFFLRFSNKLSKQSKIYLDRLYEYLSQKYSACQIRPRQSYRMHYGKQGKLQLPLWSERYRPFGDLFTVTYGLYVPITILQLPGLEWWIFAFLPNSLSILNIIIKMYKKIACNVCSKIDTPCTDICPTFCGLYFIRQKVQEQIITENPPTYLKIAM